MAIIPRKKLCPAVNKSWKFPYDMVPEFYVVHNTANDASADNEITYMNRTKAEGGKQVSYHYAIDDKEVVQGLEENVNGWHASDGPDGPGNRKGIGIEICWSKSGGDRFIKAEKLAAEFIAQELKKKGWGLDKVKKHQDFDPNGKYCPHRTLDMGWQRFLNMIDSYMNPVPEPVPTAKFEKGEVVNFKGGKHYTSSSGSTGYNVTAGPAKITAVSIGNAHPYHVVHTDSSSAVYGWVDAADIEGVQLTAPTPTPAPAPVVTEIKKGDTVYFKGGKNYVSSSGGIGYNRKAGYATVTNIAKGKKYPYHVVRTKNGGSNVYGWVAADLIKK